EPAMGLVTRAVSGRVVDELAVRLSGATEHAIEEIVRILCDAIRRAGSTEGGPIRDALAVTKGFPGVTGDITMDGERNPRKPAVVLRIEGGQFRYVTTIQP
ncbi:MAG: hypothetical protein ACREBE_23205, partial [bacterium]